MMRGQTPPIVPSWKASSPNIVITAIYVQTGDPLILICIDDILHCH